MDDLQDVIDELLGQAEALPHGAGRIALLTEAIALADHHQVEYLAYELRSDALWPLYHGKRADLLLVHFTWCVAYFDRHPELDPTALLWTFRWVIDSMPWFPEFTKTQIDASWEDMRSRYERAGFSQRPVWVLKRRNAMKMGDYEAAKEANRRYRRFRRDFLCDDVETEDAFDTYYLAFLKQDRAAIERAKPFLDGTYTDAHFLVGIYDTLLLPLTKLGRVEEAKVLQKKVARFVATRPQFLGSADDQIEFLAVVEDFAGALKQVEKHFRAAYQLPGRIDFFSTLLAMKVLCMRLQKAGRHKTLLPAPKGMMPDVTEDKVLVGVMDEWLSGELPLIAKLADDRNETPYYTNRLSEIEELNALADRIAAGPA
jgi:hypothetical protein